MSNYNKYASDGSGALNPFWVGEQEYNRQLDDYLYAYDYINDYFDNQSVTKSYLTDEDVDTFMSLLADEAVEKSKPICRVIDNQITLEDQFNFLKAHSDSKEDLELAEKVLYYHNMK